MKPSNEREGSRVIHTREGVKAPSDMGPLIRGKSLAPLQETSAPLLHLASSHTDYWSVYTRDVIIHQVNKDESKGSVQWSMSKNRSEP